MFLRALITKSPTSQYFVIFWLFDNVCFHSQAFLFIHLVSVVDSVVVEKEKVEIASAMEKYNSLFVALP